MSELRQLPLALRLDDSATFENFYVGEQNRLPVTALREQAEGRGQQWVYLYGRKGSGCSHLLQACCHLAEQRSAYSRYLPVAELLDYPPEQLLEGAEELDLLCLDGVDAAAGNADWEQALFNCYNRLLASGTAMLVAAECPAQQLAIQLPDLQSRINGFSVFALQALDEEEQLQALQFRARCQGMELPREVAEYIYTRSPRDMPKLFAVIEQLERDSLAEQRRLTIPFVKSVLGW